MEIRGIHKTIGIGGVSRSGKSQLASEIGAFYQAQGLGVGIFSQDDFVLPIEQIPKIRDHIDWEIPESIDWIRWEKALGKAQLEYDVVLAEGLFVFLKESQQRFFDYRIFIQLPKEEFVRRKSKDLRWGLEPDWYIEYIWECFLKYGQMPEGLVADQILDGMIGSKTEINL